VSRHRAPLPPRPITERRSRAENEAPWEPPPGMTKRRCEDCAFWFSAIKDHTHCPECMEIRRLGLPPRRDFLRL
jgi:hypothetical protein